MHPHSALSRPSPKRSLSCAGLDDLEGLFHGSDNARTHPNRKRHQSLNNDNNFAATNFEASSSPSRHDYTPPPASYPGALRRPELPPFSEKNSSSGHLVPPASSSFGYRYTQASSNQPQAIDQQNSSDSDEEDNNYDEEHSDDFNNELNANYGSFHEYKDSGSFSAPNLVSQEPHDALENRPKRDYGTLTVKHFDHNALLHRSSGSECSPREEYLVQAFGPSGFKLHGTPPPSKDELDDCFSDDSSNNNREHSSSSHGAAISDADTELKMSFNELEADIRGAMHQNPHHYQHSSRLPELTGLSHLPFPSSSHGPFGLSRDVSYNRSNQDVHRAPVFGQAQAPHLHPVQNQKETGYFPRDQQHQSTPRAALDKTVQNKGTGGTQVTTKWLRDEDERLRVAVARFGGKNWKMIAETLGNGRTDVQCLHRWNKVLKPGLIKGPWTPEEDRILTSLITRYGVGKIRWCDLALHLPGRIGKQCRERWCNHLDSRIRKGQWTPEEDDMVFRWQQKLGNKWSEIAKLLPGRTENAVKNRFNSAARRKWLMNQANKSPSTSSAQNEAQVSAHVQFQQQQNVALQLSSTSEEEPMYSVNGMPYGGNGKVVPLPRSAPSAKTATLGVQMEEYYPHKVVSSQGRQSFVQNYALPGNPSLLPSSVDNSHPSFRSALPVSGQSMQQQRHQGKASEGGKGDSICSLPPTAFVPPPLNSLFPPPPGVNSSPGAGRSFHNASSASASGEAVTTPVFPFTATLPSQQDTSVVMTPRVKCTSGSDQDDGQHFKEEKLEQDDLVLQTSTEVPEAGAAPDVTVPMDDENMNSFLDSVALELDDIME
ncbi:hypothetical protein KRP22_012062 [Phytophthora ramorum]|uniref:Transcriptional activator Myb n=1 Tax=Phytophthora ramorum TaxID=164328 RepID=UPI0030B2060B|nr:Transcriptional activator Myb [Phytophthora ramorum]KAH7498760.1 Transcriptional activator Myb [Phytophthora ramorum]